MITTRSKIKNLNTFEEQKMTSNQNWTLSYCPVVDSDLIFNEENLHAVPCFTDKNQPTVTNSLCVCKCFDAGPFIRKKGKCHGTVQYCTVLCTVQCVQ